MPVSRPLMRTSSRGRCLAAPTRLRNSSAAVRAPCLRSGTIESSRSTITASVPLASALSSLAPPSAGTNRSERMCQSLLSFLNLPEIPPRCAILAQELSRPHGVWGRGGTTHANQKSHNAFCRCFRRRFCNHCRGAGACTTANVCDHQGRRHRQRLYLPLSKPSGDVHRHRPDQLWPSAGGKNVSGGNPENHQGSDQVFDL